MTDYKFTCDREWWSALDLEEQNRWLDWAESCGADRTPVLCDRNPDYPDLVCTPSVSLGAFKTEDMSDELIALLTEQLKDYK